MSKSSDSEDQGKAGRSRQLPITDLPILLGRHIIFQAETAEPPDERRSRLKREEAEAEHTLRGKAEADARERRLALLSIFS